MSVRDLPTHPAADVLPKLSDDELAALADDIRQHGQRDAIVVWVDERGQRFLLDGRHRARACEIAGVEPRIIEATCEQIPDPHAFVRSKNLQRRNLRAFQVAIAWFLLGGTDKHLSARAAADAANTSRETMRMARLIVERDPALARRVLNAEIPIRVAFDSVTRDNGAPLPSVEPPSPPLEPPPIAREPIPTWPAPPAPIERAQPREPERVERTRPEPDVETRQRRAYAAARRCALAIADPNARAVVLADLVRDLGLVDHVVGELRRGAARDRVSRDADGREARA